MIINSEMNLKQSWIRGVYKDVSVKTPIDTNKKIKQKNYDLSGSIPIVDQGMKLIGGFTDDPSSIVSCPLPVIIFGDHTRVVKYVNFPFAAGADGIVVLRPKSFISPKFYFYQTIMLTDVIENKGYARHYQHLEKQYFVYPPLPEQERIVARIEELFSDLDKGIEALQTIKAQLKVYRQAVLKEAFEGALCDTETEPLEYFYLALQQKRIALGNRQQYALLEHIELPEIPSEWRWVCIGDIISDCDYGTSSKSSVSGNVPVIRMGNLQNGRIDWNDLAFSSDETEINKYQLKPNDVLFNRTNSPEWVGKTAIFKGEQPAIFAGYLIRVNYLPGINPQYLTYFLNSPVARAYGKKVKTDGVNQSNINATKLCSYPFPLCSTQAQEKTVVEIESRLSVCDKIEQTVDESLAKAESLRQSILKKAFEGNL